MKKEPVKAIYQEINTAIYASFLILLQITSSILLSYIAKGMLLQYQVLVIKFTIFCCALCNIIFLYPNKNIFNYLSLLFPLTIVYQLYKWIQVPEFEILGGLSFSSNVLTDDPFNIGLTCLFPSGFLIIYQSYLIFKLIQFKKVLLDSVDI